MTSRTPVSTAGSAPGAGPRARGLVAPSGLTRRLVAAHAVVVATMAVAMVLVAAVVGPALFHAHIVEAGHGDHPAVLAHAEEAFRSAGVTSVVVGIVVAAVSAMLASVLLARRIGAGLDALAAGAQRVAAGRYDEPVALPAASHELAPVVSAFNAMAADIDATEATRRRLLTDLGHELRTPLAVIDVTLEGLEDGVVALDAATIATLRAQTQRLERLARDVKEVSAAEEGRLTISPAPTPVARLLDAARAAAEPAAAAHGIDLHVDASDPSVVLADPARVGQVLDNLLRNAVQHTPSGGRISVTTRVDGANVDVAVTDTGSGVAAEHLPHLFERFYRADPGRARDATSGTGVGLAIARALALAHGGELTAQSDGPGRGATFVLSLPRAGGEVSAWAR